MRRLPIYLGLYAFLLSITVLPYYVGGDQAHYRLAFSSVAESNLIDGFYYYKNSIGSSEPILFFVYYISSHFMSKDVLISIVNGCLGFIGGKLLIEKRVSLALFPLFVFNYYLLILMFAAERLKFSILFVLF